MLFVFSHRLLAVVRWDLHLIRVRFVNAVMLQGPRMRRKVAAMPRPVFLNLGSGPRGVEDPHWVNVDGFRDRRVEWLLDITRPLPLGDERVDGVFCEHVLEHFALEDGEAVASEAFRVLRPGGVLRVIVPDGELVMRRYFDAPDELVSRREADRRLPMVAVNSFFRQRYEHQFLYDWPTIRQCLMRAGFRQVCRVAYRQSCACPEIVLDDGKYEWESLYVEARKAPGVNDPAAVQTA
jgi:predicted SAM-dependent methyltransferase